MPYPSRLTLSLVEVLERYVILPTGGLSCCRLPVFSLQDTTDEAAITAAEPAPKRFRKLLLVIFSVMMFLFKDCYSTRCTSCPST